MNVVFVAPPVLDNGRFTMAEDCCWGTRGTRILPIMMLSCASQMEDASFVDLSIDPPSKLREKKADVVIYPLMWNNHEEIHQKMSQICGNTPTIILAVPSGYMLDHAMLKPRPYAVIYSEPEKVVKGLDRLSTRGDLQSWRAGAKGIAWANQSDVVHKTEPLPTCMDDLEDTNFHIVPTHYWRHYGVLGYQISRGCPYRCHFCVWGGSTVTDPTFKMRPAKQTAEDLMQLRSLAKEHNAKALIYTLSAQLTTNLNWIKQFRDYMARDPYLFQGNVNLYDLTDEKMQLLKESGLTSISVGVEAVTDSLLEKMNKKHRFKHIIQSMKVLDKHYDRYICHLRIGFGETDKDIAETNINLARIKRAGIHNARFHFGPIVFYKGTYWGEHPPCPVERHNNLGYPAYCPRMAGIPDWRPAAELLKRYGWVK